MSEQNEEPAGISLTTPPSGAGCVECAETSSWWLHLRRCAECGHVGCCDDSPNQHATAHFHGTGHPVMQTFEPGESWFWNFETAELFDGPELAAPQHHPVDQPTPGPRGLVPPNWPELLHT